MIYDATGFITLKTPLVVGQAYTWKPGANEVSLTCGDQTFATQRTFTAGVALVTIQGVAGGASYTGRLTVAAVQSTGSGLARVSIATTFTTRAYNNAELERWQAVGWHVETWWPKFGVALLFPGQEMKPVLTDVTRSRTDYMKPFDRAAYDVSNTNGDHAAPYRQDYSVDFNTGVLLGAAGVALDRFQDATWARSVARNIDSALQIQITNAQGRIKILSTNAEATAGPRRKGTFS